MKKNFLYAFALAGLLTMTACSSDTVEGNPSALTQGMLTTVQEDGTTMYFLDLGGGMVAVTYNRANPRHLNESNSAVLTDYVGNVTVPSQVNIGGINYTVTAVTDGAFACNTTLKTLTLPETVTIIGEGAFTRCTGMTSINIPTSVSTIPEACFGACSSLKELTLPEGVTTIGPNAFYGCSKITALTLPAALTSIGQNAFTRCTGLKELTLPERVSSIGAHAFLSDSKLVKLHVKATTPPVLTDSLTDNKKMVLYVPAGSKEAYANAAYWNKFLTIEEE